MFLSKKIKTRILRAYKYSLLFGTFSIPHFFMFVKVFAEISIILKNPDEAVLLRRDLG